MKQVDISAFLDSDDVVIDARSEKEFDHAHFPGAVNIPLLNNEHRHEVGTAYKKHGREAAVLLGFELAGPLFASMIRKAIEAAPQKNVRLYCWRGGMRSGIMSYLLSVSGFKVTLLKGGYKAFRHWALNTLTEKKLLHVIGGKTGSGKTELLRTLGRLSEQIIDLEALANHKGSAFGSLGQKPQPSLEHFENMLAMEWTKLNPDRPTWIENESRAIGRVKIPDPVFDQMQKAKLFNVGMSNSRRMQRIMEEYGGFSVDELKECTARLKKRLGDLRTRQALEALDEKRYSDWLENLFIYYDKGYSFSMIENKRTPVNIPVADDESIEDVAKKMVSKQFINAG
jgi:tRNA 2-selenouridine synthase